MKHFIVLRRISSFINNLFFCYEAASVEVNWIDVVVKATALSLHVIF